MVFYLMIQVDLTALPTGMDSGFMSLTPQQLLVMKTRLLIDSAGKLFPFPLPVVKGCYEAVLRPPGHCCRINP
jgi:hypothetical protein